MKFSFKLTTGKQWQGNGFGYSPADHMMYADSEATGYELRGERNGGYTLVKPTGGSEYAHSFKAGKERAIELYCKALAEKASTDIWNMYTEAQKAEIRLYGATVEEMDEALRNNQKLYGITKAEYAFKLISDAQKLLAQDKDGAFDFMLVEDARQTLNRAKYALVWL